MVEKGASDIETPNMAQMELMEIFEFCVSCLALQVLTMYLQVREEWSNLLLVAGAMEVSSGPASYKCFMSSTSITSSMYKVPGSNLLVVACWSILWPALV